MHIKFLYLVHSVQYSFSKRELELVTYLAVAFTSGCKTLQKCKKIRENNVTILEVILLSYLMFSVFDLST